MRKLLTLILVLIFSFSVCFTALGKLTPTSKTINERYDDQGIDKLLYCYAKINPSPDTIFEKTPWAKEKCGWNMLVRTSRTFVNKSTKEKHTEDVILTNINCPPYLVQRWVEDSTTDCGPDDYEVLAINNKPVQIFIPTTEDAVKGGISLENAQKYADYIRECLTDPTCTKKYFSTLPQGNGKMVSVFMGGQVAAYYTADSVKAGFLSARPVITSNIPYVPLKDICSYLGATITYDSKTKTTKVVRGSKTALIKTGSKAYTLNGQKKTLDGTPYISDGSLMVPVSFMSELGYRIKTFNGGKLKYDIYN